MLTASPGATDDYIRGDPSLKFIRCRPCCRAMQWKSLVVSERSNTGVNARNFVPSAVGPIGIRLLDGANTWKYVG